MYTINFTNVGGGKANWAAQLRQQPTLAIIERLVRKQKVLASRDVQCLFNDDGDGGHVYAGMRSVGAFSITKATGASS